MAAGGERAEDFDRFRQDKALSELIGDELPTAPALRHRHKSHDPDGGTGLDLIRRHRRKAGTIKHTHDVLMNELAGWCLPNQKFGANAAWLRINMLLYNLLSAFKRVGLPEEMHNARPKRLRFLVLNTVEKVVHHVRKTLLRLGDAVARALAAAPQWPTGGFDRYGRGMRAGADRCACGHYRIRIHLWFGFASL